MPAKPFCHLAACGTPARNPNLYPYPPTLWAQQMVTCGIRNRWVFCHGATNSLAAAVGVFSGEPARDAGNVSGCLTSLYCWVPVRFVADWSAMNRKEVLCRATSSRASTGDTATTLGATDCCLARPR